MPERGFYCELCEERVTHDAPNDDVYEGIAAAMDHFRVYHPDTYDEIERWPDDAPVVVDTTDPPTSRDDG